MSSVALAPDRKGGAFIAWIEASDRILGNVLEEVGLPIHPLNIPIAPDTKILSGPAIAQAEKEKAHVAWSEYSFAKNQDTIYTTAFTRGGRVGLTLGPSTPFPNGQAPVTFIRGDADGNGAVNLTDALFILLNHLFRGGDPPPAPYPAAGIDPTQDGLG